MTAPAISIIVPVFNEGGTIAEVIRRLLTIDLPGTRELLIIDDGSSDGTRQILEAMPASDHVVVVYSDRNRGKGSAVRAGLQRARGGVIAIQDADLELDPAQLASLVGPVLDGRADVVYGSRFLGGRPPAPWLTIAANRLLTMITNVLYGSRLTDMETCYKIMRIGVARSLDLQADRFDIEPEITAKLLRAGHRILEVPVTFEPRTRAAGKKIGWRDALHAVAVLVRHRVRR